eukprot:6474165-Amphidinium_carterae.2
MTCSASDGSEGGGCEGLRILGRLDGLRCLGGHSAGVVRQPAGRSSGDSDLRVFQLVLAP